MATYAMEIYLRDLLEADDAMVANPNTSEFLNNTAIIRMGSHEARLGGNYNFPGPRVDVHGQARYRRRVALDDADNLPAVVQALPADQQLDLSAGVRHKRSLAGLTLGANVILIRGDRTSDNIVSLRAGRGFLGDRLQLDTDLTYIGYADQCAFMGMVPVDPTCTGQATGSTLRVGALLVWQRDRHWQLLGDYHYGWNASEKDGVPHPDVGSHQLFVRAQYTY
jgi:hypothetical protein